MNFIGVSSFDYVTGDLSEITIDNNIMPVRTGDAANHLRGIDIAFIKEAIEERRRAVEKSAATPSFSASITAGQINGIDQQLLDMFYDDNSWEWLDGFPSTSVNGYMTFVPSTYSNIPTTMSGWDFGVNRISKPSAAGTISADDGLLASAVAAMYSKVGACKVFTTPRAGSFTDAPYSLTDLGYFGPSEYETSRVEYARQWIADAFTGINGMLHQRYCYGQTGSITMYYGMEGGRSASDLPALSFSNSFAGSAKIYAVFGGYDYTGGPGNILLKTFMKYINDGTTVDNNALMSVADAIWGGFYKPSPSDCADLGLGTHTPSLNIRKLFCVYALRNRTRWDV